MKLSFCTASKIGTVRVTNDVILVERKLLCARAAVASQSFRLQEAGCSSISKLQIFNLFTFFARKFKILYNALFNERKCLFVYFIRFFSAKEFIFFDLSLTCLRSFTNTGPIKSFLRISSIPHCSNQAFFFAAINKSPLQTKLNHST